MSAALAHPVPTTRRGARRPVRLRVVAAPAGPDPATGGGRAAGRPARPAVPPDEARGARGAARATAAGPRAGFLLVPLGEVLVPVGGPPVLRVAPGGEAVGVGRGRVTGRGVGAAGSPVPSGRRRRTGSAASRRGAACAHGCGPGVRRRRGTPRARRAVVAVLAVFLVAGGARGAIGGGGGSVAAAAVPAAQQVVVVEQGQTLWSLARDLAPEEDPREVVQRLRSANRLESAGLAVGQRLVVPPPG